MHAPIIATALVILAADFPRPGEARIACSERPTSREYWSWREIDGRKCWFIGHSSMPKSQLYWRRDHGDGVRRANSDRAVHDRADDLRVLPGPDVNEPPPQLPPLGAFERTWRDMMFDLYISPFWMERTPATEWK